ncbi:MAG: dTDP-4-dehydrorhamnose reductase [Candidatus Berkelbacteria bacterium]|nr:MAG: dTDP-4-dehydrorhamnose reductase [Candidatus Berkelbacteria bacterium]QQG51700.1 MAG: dTDP-4-dehydrorhamnose reductase [Candidatus Berkelbacteria bacterium]
MNIEPRSILILGSDGQLGSELSGMLPEAEKLSYPDWDITNPADDAVIAQMRPKVIVNCAAFTNVDRAESEQEVARAVNAEAPGRLAKLAHRLGALFVQVSTDYVFDGHKGEPYAETDTPNPLNVYGKTKLAGEQMVAESGAKYLIVRTAWLHGPKGPNFLSKMLELAKTNDELTVVADQKGSPTFTADLARAIMALIDQGQTGLFHAVNSGSASRYELVRELFQLAELKTRVKSGSSEEFPAAAMRPPETVLDTSKLQKFFVMPTWQDGLKRYWLEASKAH